MRKKPDDPQQAALPDPPTNDLWFSIPALGLYDKYVTNTELGLLGHGLRGHQARRFRLPVAERGEHLHSGAPTRAGPAPRATTSSTTCPLLQIGDIVYLGDVNGTTYTYKVSGFKEIAPNETSVTGPQDGRDMVSLQTCIENYGDYWTMGPNWYVRYIVQADRVSVTPAK